MNLCESRKLVDFYLMNIFFSIFLLLSVLCNRYNFLVGGDGSVMEGQGWDKIGAHTFNYNTGSVGIALIGNFADASPTQPTLDAVKRLIERGVALDKLSRNYKLYAHCQLIQAASPGVNVFNEIKNWPHWNAMNAIRCTQ